MGLISEHMLKKITAADVVSSIQSGQRVFIHGGSATPNVLIGALIEQADRLRDVELIHVHTEGAADYANAAFNESFLVTNLFVGSNMRSKMNYGRVDYLPCFLSEIPKLFRSKRRPIDVAILHLSPPDKHGYCSLGTSVDVARAAYEAADVVLAQINAQMPRVHGDGFIPIDDVDCFIEVDVPLPQPKTRLPTPEEQAIGRFTADLIEDGSCLQVGIGAVPDAVLAALKNHRHLGIHTEMWSDGVLKLIKAGAIDNSRKKVHRGKCVSGFIIGSQAVYDYIHDNPAVIQLGIDYVNSAGIIARNPKVAAINSAVEIDLTGQVCADSLGRNIISGVGGQMDFIRGASLSEGGKPIIAMESRTRKSVSRIVTELKPGAGVVTTRAHVHHVVTEYGAADLFGKTLNERARALIDIAHPGDRERLAREWRER
jgi:4-hydroxybutyrate CoA-transferase